MSIASKLLVFLQVSCLAYLLFFTKFMSQGLLLIIQISGILLSLWAVITMRLGNFNIQPELKQNAHFVNSGPYRRIRNPMYTGLIVFFGAGILHSIELTQSIAFLILTLVLIFKIHFEEKFLEERFGSTYLLYKRKTYRLFPFVF
ncbi:methyltransferase family protein [Lutimonas sp.]|uniref:methyltransferase family protein n=1 Tax=Lutimonas sp. TaxID=1872403 RepID=UPI003C789B17